GLETGPLTLDPRFATDATASQIGDLLFDGLTRSDEQARRVPQLAVDWEEIDRVTYVFHLRDDVRFADGQPLTALDVKATYDSVLDARTGSPKQLALAAVAAVEAPDARTVRFRLRQPFAPFLEATGLGILSARQLARAPTRPLEQPTGSGAFQIRELIADEKVVITRNPTYAFGPAALEGIVFEVVPDAVTRLLELKRSKLDLVQNAIDPDALAWLRQQPNIEILTHPGTTVQYLGFNLRDPHLADVRVRQAIAHAIDRDAIIRTILKGLATPATGLLPPPPCAST